jgi:5-formyltetrahydrofolate cyclo-ligase
MRQSEGQSEADSKLALRRQLRDQRCSLSAALRAKYDEAVRQHLLKLINSRKILSIACYQAFNGEPDIAPLCRQLHTRAYELALPVVSGHNDHAMQFHAWHAKTTLAKNRYGILEPRGTAAVPVSEFDMLIMPLVGYDRFGNRLGMGSGYYDRHLESLRGLDSPLRVGVAYSLQEIEPIRKNNWDIPLHGIVNEHGWFTFVH